MSVLTCADCEAASKAPWHGFRNGCAGCAARAVARGFNFRRCRDAGTQDRAYRQELALLNVTHQQVIEAAQADHMKAAK